MYLDVFSTSMPTVLAEPFAPLVEANIQLHTRQPLLEPCNRG